MRIIGIIILGLNILFFSCSKNNTCINVEGPFRFRTVVGKEPITFLPYCVKFDDRSNQLIVSDTKKCKLFILSPEGRLIYEIGRRGEAQGEFLFPKDIGIDENGRIYVLDNNRIKIFNAQGIELASFKPKGIPWRICVKDTDEIYILSSKPVNGKILLKYDWRGRMINMYLTGKMEKNPFLQMLSNQGSVTCDNEGNIYVAFTNEYRVVKLDREGKVFDNYIKKSVPYKIIRPHKRKKPDEKMMSIVIADITCDERGYLYVLWGENVGKSYYRVDVYNKIGKLIGFMKLKVSNGGFFNSLAVHSNSIYVCETQSDGLIYKFKVEGLP